MKNLLNARLPFAVLGLLILSSASAASLYSALTYEAIVDSIWDSAIKPLLMKRFPASAPDELTGAHGYGYNGTIIQDLGYYPGTLAHCVGDNNGHRMATNVSVPLLYPSLRLSFGKAVTYADADDPFSHTKTEFGFDVFQVAKSRYASDAYKAFIGFQVAKSVLQCAFQDTYGLPIEQVFFNVDLAIGSYRRPVSTVLLALTKVPWQIKSQEIRKDAPGITRKKVLYNLSRSSYEKNWGATYQRPGTGSRMLAGFFRIVPRADPLKALVFKRLTPETEKLHMAGFNASIDRYRDLLAGAGNLLQKLDSRPAEIPQDLRSDILAFYPDLNVPIATEGKASEWVRLQEELQCLAVVDHDLAGADAAPRTDIR